MKGCRPIIKSGKIHCKPAIRGQYRHVQLILASGHLIQFHLSNNTHMHYERGATINLLDAYILSGYFAALNLARREYTPDMPSTARKFGDGLETHDKDEDTLFMLWYRPHASVSMEELDIQPVEAISASDGQPSAGSRKGGVDDSHIPELSAKRKVLICRARSRLERDSWCWALNCEIERLVRATRAREQKARARGGLKDNA